MTPQILEVLRCSAGLVAGGLVGICFGLVQEAAGWRYQKLENAGKFSTGWAIMPGSMRRVAALLVALALVQVLCPLLFANGSQWWVSGGLVASYGLVLFRQLRQRLALNH